METYEDSGEKEESEISHQPVETRHSHPYEATQMPSCGPSASASGVHSSFVSLRKKSRDVTTPTPHPNHVIQEKKQETMSPSFEARFSGLKLSDPKEVSNTCEEEYDIPLSQIKKR